MTGSPPPADDEQSSRDEILAMLKAEMDALHNRTMTADPDSPEAEKLQLKRVRALGSLANQYRKLKRDTDIDEMEERMEFLEKRRDVVVD